MASLSKKIKVGLLIAVPVVLIGAGVWFFANGYVKVGSPSEVANQSAGKCSSLVERYNSAFGNGNRDEFSAILTETSDAVKKVNGFETDANCVYMQYSLAIFNRDADEAVRLAGSLKMLSEKGQYITGHVANPRGIDAITTDAESLKAQPTESSEQQGNG